MREKIGIEVPGVVLPLGERPPEPGSSRALRLLFPRL
jgi:hypothetical protein